MGQSLDGQYSTDEQTLSKVASANMISHVVGPLVHISAPRRAQTLAENSAAGGVREKPCGATP
jgi:hypothetical protein